MLRTMRSRHAWLSLPCASDGRSVEDREDVALAEDEELLLPDLHLGAGVGAVDDAIVDLDLRLDDTTVLELATATYGHHDSLPRLLLRGVRKHDSAGGFLLGFQTSNNDVVAQRMEFRFGHRSYLLGKGSGSRTRSRGAKPISRATCACARGDGHRAYRKRRRPKTGAARQFAHDENGPDAKRESAHGTAGPPCRGARTRRRRRPGPPPAAASHRLRSPRRASAPPLSRLRAAREVSQTLPA